MADRIPARLTPSQGRRFAFPVGTAFLALAGLTWWRDRLAVSLILGSLGTALWLVGLTIPGRLGPLYRAWMGLAHAISRVTTPVFLGLVYFLTIAPIGLVMRLVGRNPVRHRAVNGSYWAPRNEPRGTLTNQF